jgi:hypothetical protein
MLRCAQHDIPFGLIGAYYRQTGNYNLAIVTGDLNRSNGQIKP